MLLSSKNLTRWGKGREGKGIRIVFRRKGQLRWNYMMGWIGGGDDVEESMYGIIPECGVGFGCRLGFASTIWDGTGVSLRSIPCAFCGLSCRII